jgi:hypothetical protein
MIGGWIIERYGYQAMYANSIVITLSASLLFVLVQKAMKKHNKNSKEVMYYETDKIQR